MQSPRKSRQICGVFQAAISSESARALGGVWEWEGCFLGCWCAIQIASSAGSVGKVGRPVAVVVAGVVMIDHAQESKGRRKKGRSQVGQRLLLLLLLAAVG